MLSLAAVNEPMLEWLYRTTWADRGKIFPIIHAVLLGQQPGHVWMCRTRGGSGQAALICHAAGFALCVGDVDAREFTEAVKALLCSETNELPSYLLWYGPPDTLATWVTSHGGRLRRRLRLFAPDDWQLKAGHDAALGKTMSLTDDLVHQIQTLGLAKPLSFWPTAGALVDTALGVAIVTDDGTVAGVCYPAAIADGKAEVDIAIQAPLRGKGLGRYLVWEFVQRCRQQGTTAVWDCFTENQQSLGLARSQGFVEAYGYDFYSFNLPVSGSNYPSS